MFLVSAAHKASVIATPNLWGCSSLTGVFLSHVALSVHVTTCISQRREILQRNVCTASSRIFFSNIIIHVLLILFLFIWLNAHYPKKADNYLNIAEYNIPTSYWYNTIVQLQSWYVVIIIYLLQLSTGVILFLKINYFKYRKSTLNKIISNNNGMDEMFEKVIPNEKYLVVISVDLFL